MPRSTKKGEAEAPPLIINGWTIYAHPQFLTQLEAYRQAVEAAKAKDATGYVGTREAKLLAAIVKLAFEEIPKDPAAPQYRQGDTLGPKRKHWFRAKFFQQYRLFFRFDAAAKVIVFAWVNNEDTKRAYGYKSDAYATFRKMLDKGNPPDSWSELLQAASGKDAKSRLGKARA